MSSMIRSSMSHYYKILKIYLLIAIFGAVLGVVYQIPLSGEGFNNRGLIGAIVLVALISILWRMRAFRRINLTALQHHSKDEAKPSFGDHLEKKRTP